MEQLSRETGIAFRLKLYEKMSVFEQEIVTSAGPDFIFVHPFQMIVAHDSQGYVPLIRSSKPIQTELFVRKDSPVKSVDDLAGKNIAFVGHKNF